MRSLSLAEAFRDRGHKVSFFSKYQSGIDVITRKGFGVSKLPEWDSNTSIAITFLQHFFGIT